MESTESTLDLGGIELRPISGYPGYAAGSDGHIYSFKRQSTAKDALFPRRRLIGSPIGGRGGGRYLAVSLQIDGQQNTILVHRLIAEAFHGPCPEGMQCSHVNGNRADNRPENLEWEMATTNNRRKTDHGTMARGKKLAHAGAKLTPEDVRNIRDFLSRGHVQREVARLHGVSPATVCRIARGHCWAWLE